MTKCELKKLIIPVTIALGAFLNTVYSLRLVAFKVPSHKLFTSSAILHCLFELEENSTLYSVKWYKNGEEFYRYVPADTPPAQFFPTPGIIIDVASSDKYQVALRGLSTASSGVYLCEVSTEAPVFHTVSAQSRMTVTALPLQSPHITGLKGIYNEGEIVSVNCTSMYSKPSTQLAWYINNKKASDSWITVFGPEENHDSLDSITLRLSVRASADLFPSRVISLRCVTTIGNDHWQHQRWALLRIPKPSNTAYRAAYHKQIINVIVCIVSTIIYSVYFTTCRTQNCY